MRQYLLWRILPPCWCQVASSPYCLMPGGILHLVSAVPKNLSLKSMKELLQIGRLQWPITNSSSTIEYIFISSIESNASSSRIESSKAVEQDWICYYSSRIETNTTAVAGSNWMNSILLQQQQNRIYTTTTAAGSNLLLKQQDRI